MTYAALAHANRFEVDGRQWECFSTDANIAKALTDADYSSSVGMAMGIPQAGITRCCGVSGLIRKRLARSYPTAPRRFICCSFIRPP